jgi:hypothetical protein
MVTEPDPRAEKIKDRKARKESLRAKTRVLGFAAVAQSSSRLRSSRQRRTKTARNVRDPAKRKRDSSATTRPRIPPTCAKSSKPMIDWLAALVRRLSGYLMGSG